MYLNLRTEGSSNLLLVPKQAIQLFDEQDDLMTISLADARTDPELVRPLGFAERKLWHFRGIPAEAVNRCQ